MHQAEDMANVAVITVASTGLFENSFEPEMCQLALTKLDGTKLFLKYILPQRSFQKDASKVNGFTVEEVDGERRLMREGEEIKTQPLQDVLKDFLRDISSFRAQVNGRIILVGYYSYDFDIPLLLKEMKRCQISCEIFKKQDVIFADVYQLVRSQRYKLVPYCENLKMTTVYNALCNSNSPYRHDAMEDANKLGAIFTRVKDLVDPQTFKDSEMYFLVDENGVQELEKLPPPPVQCTNDTAELACCPPKKKRKV